MKPFRKIQTQDQQLAQVQQATADSFQGLQAIPLLSGALLSSLVLVPGRDNVISHTLNRPINGALLMLPSSQATIWASQTNNQEPSKYIYLQCSDDTTVSVWVF